MAKLANTFVSTDATGNREELSDVVNRITPEDTPLYSLIGAGSCKTTHPEWEIDQLAPPADNRVTEGDEYDFDAIDPVVRVQNHTQIMRKTLIVSGSQEAEDNAGDAEKMKNQKLKRGIELRKDVELSIVGNNASVSGENRQSGALATWMETNVDRGAGGANGGFSQATKLTVAPTAGAKRAFTKGLLDAQMQQAYESGANVTYAMTSPYVKSVFTTFMSDANVAQFRYAASNGDNNSIVATADVYEGDFGKVMIVPNRVMAVNADVASNVFLLDPSMAQFCWFRKIKQVKNLANTGDSKKAVILGEGTLKVKNEAGLAVIADVFGKTATT